MHYHSVVLSSLPSPCRRVLDVGCGEGALTRSLRERVPEVVGIDVDEASIELARAQDPSGDIDYRVGDFLALSFEPPLFDAVVSVAALHHMDAVSGLTHMASLVRPGGAVCVVGLARSAFPIDLPRDMAAVVASRAYRLQRGWWEHPSPKAWPPPHTYDQMQRIVAARLPGARFRRHLFWRYSVVWTKPG